MFQFLDYYRKPKYVVMKGISVGNRSIMYIGANPTFRVDDYGNRVVTFSNCKHEYYASNIYRRVWTKKALIKWRRLIGDDTRCLVKTGLKWQRA